MKLKFRIFSRSSAPKIIMLMMLVIFLLAALLLPTLLFSRPEDSILAYNRDATSGTREAFSTLVLGEKDFSPSKNVREVKGNDQMITAVNKNKNSIGYVSLGTVAEFDGEDAISIKRENANFDIASFNNVIPTKANIENGTYNAARDFNSFFRVEKGSDEAKILDYDLTTNSISEDVSSLSSNLKASYLFYEWSTNSAKAIETLNANGQIASPDNKGLDFSVSNIETYFNNVGLDSKNEDVTIEIVGSTSASEAENILIKEFKNEFGSEFHSLTISPMLNGSGDAFKKDIPGAINPYIGLQSRGFGLTEASDWGWDETDVPYSSFAKDAIAIIYNTTGLEEVEGYRNINSEEIDNLYTNDDYMNFEELFGGGK